MEWGGLSWSGVEWNEVEAINLFPSIHPSIRPSIETGYRQRYCLISDLS